MLAGALSASCATQPKTQPRRDLEIAKGAAFEGLPPGADLLLLQPESRAFELPPSFGATLPGRSELLPNATTRAGVLLSRMTYKHRQLSPLIRWTADSPFERESEYAQAGFEPGLCVSKLDCLVHRDGTQIRRWREELAVEQQDARGRAGFESDRSLYIRMFSTLYPALADGFRTLAEAFTIEVSVAADRPRRLELSLHDAGMGAPDERALLAVCDALESSHTQPEDDLVVCTGARSGCDVEIRMDFSTFADGDRSGSASLHLKCP